MQFGKKMNMGGLDQLATNEMVKFAIDHGINFIDTADVYSLGESEILLGNALKGIREEIVLASKVRLPMSENFNRSGATRVNIIRGVESSLKRLQTDYLDLYQIHGWDSNTPLEETLRTLDDLVRQGLVMPGSRVDQEHPEGYVSTTLFRGSGSSQAAAVVSGAVALLLELALLLDGVALAEHVGLEAGQVGLAAIDVDPGDQVGGEVDDLLELLGLEFLLRLDAGEEVGEPRPGATEVPDVHGQCGQLSSM